MAKAKNPTTLSGYFNLDREQLDSLGVLDPTLAIDSKLFIVYCSPFVKPTLSWNQDKQKREPKLPLLFLICSFFRF